MNKRQAFYEVRKLSDKLERAFKANGMDQTEPYFLNNKIWHIADKALTPANPDDGERK